MPRPVNYIVKLRKWIRTANGNTGLKLALQHTINEYVAGEAKLEEVNKMVDKFTKTVVEVKESGNSEEEALDEMLQEYLNSSLEN